jgi:hypothetical protein
VFIRKRLILQEDFGASLVAKGICYADMQMAAKHPGQKGYSLHFSHFFENP